MSKRRTVRVIVTGRVQGVGYRDWMSDVAERRSLHGWVCNRRDGTVEAVLAGARDDVDAVLALMRGGPGFARVDKVRIVEEDGTPPERGFAILPTA